mmetsp:Transcript_22861/g.40824  ORF Transcript_22861/g.40824 Transcript_22861/m.40824 type:complete len:228 (+) Transcript_22861:95-778(+)
MADMTPRIEQNVSVVAIFQVEQITNHTVRRERAHEIHLCLIQRRGRLGGRASVGRVGSLEIAMKEVVQVGVVRVVALERIDGDRVGHRLDHAGLGVRSDDGIVLDPDRIAERRAQDAGHRLDELRGEGLLPEVVIRFDNDWEQTPARHVAGGRSPTDPLGLLGPLLLKQYLRRRVARAGEDVGSVGSLIRGQMSRWWRLIVLVAALLSVGSVGSGRRHPRSRVRSRD